MPPKKSTSRPAAAVVTKKINAAIKAAEAVQESSDGDGTDEASSNEGSDEENDSTNSDDEEDDDEDDDFEKQSSSDEDEGDISEDNISVDSDVEDEAVDTLQNAETTTRSWSSGVGVARSKLIDTEKQTGELGLQQYLHNDDLSSDDEEAEGNTIGRVPLHWYDAFDHIGYDHKGGKLMKRKGLDKIDLAILQQDDPTGAKTIYDMYNDREVKVSEREMEIIRRIQAGAFAHPEHDDTPDYSDYFTHKKEQMPLSAAPEPKRRFVPSKWEMMRVMKIVKAIKEGRYKESQPSADDKDKKNPPAFMIWNEEEDEIIAESRRNQFHLPAPKMPLPGHAESYNPPSEYLLTEEEKAAQEELDPSERTHNFTPKGHDCLRHVAGYENFVKERFERCLDLYLCPRKMKRRLNIDPETLVPRLPKPKELKPFPNSLCLQFLGHSAAVRSISVSPDGQYLASGSDDGTVRLWEVDTCLCRYVWDLESGPVIHVSWNPDSYHHIVSAVAGTKVVLIATGTGDADSTEVTETQLSAIEEVAADPSKAQISKAAAADADSDGEEGDKKKGSKATVAQWALCKGNDKSAKSKKGSVSSAVKRHGAIVGPRVELQFGDAVGSLAWHYKGDYLAVVVPAGGSMAVSVHQVQLHLFYEFASLHLPLLCFCSYPRVRLSTHSPSPQAACSPFRSTRVGRSCSWSRSSTSRSST